MPFDKETAKRAGEKSSREGIPNKIQKEHRDRISDLIDKIDEYQDADINAMKPIERQKLRAEYSEFVAPKLSRSEHRHEFDEDFRDVIYGKKDTED